MPDYIFPQNNDAGLRKYSNQEPVRTLKSGE